MGSRYDRYMLVVRAGNNRKFATLSDSERCAHFLGVLSVAAQSPIRGYLLISEGVEAGPEAVAADARVSVKVARTTMDKLIKVGVLVRDEEVGAWFVHDWDEVNPAPKFDPSNAERQSRFRARSKTRNGDRNAHSNGTVTADVTPDVTPPEVKKKEELLERTTSSCRAPVGVDPPQDVRSDCAEAFAYWQERCGKTRAKFTKERRRVIVARFNEGYSILDIRRGIEGAAANPPRDRDSGTVYDDLVSICRNGAQLERYMDRADAPRLRVVQGRQSPSDLLRLIQANGGEAS